MQNGCTVARCPAHHLRLHDTLMRSKGTVTPESAHNKLTEITPCSSHLRLHELPQLVDNGGHEGQHLGVAAVGGSWDAYYNLDIALAC